MLFLEFLSYLSGWVYTLCWSLSFYSQPSLSFRRRSTAGTTVDFPFLNTFGFVAYLTSNCAFYWSPSIRAQYAARNKGHAPTVAFNDIVFAAHAVLVCLVTTSQYLAPRLWGFEPRAAGTKPSRLALGVFSGSLVAVVIMLFVVIGSSSPNTDADFDARTSWAWLDVVYAVSYVKLLVTLIKYAPQLRFNHQNRSTAGWSIGQILLDFAGGVLSIGQQSIDAWLQGDWSGIMGNPVKFALGNVSILYDLLFMTQHYVLYWDHDGPSKGGEREALLERGETNGDSNARRLD